MTWLLAARTFTHTDWLAAVDGVVLVLVIVLSVGLARWLNNKPFMVRFRALNRTGWRIFRPDTNAPYRPDPKDAKQHEAVIYVRSILWMRVWVGVAGLMLPIVLLVVDRLYFHGHPEPRDSMSAYYWSGMRDVFVTVIFGTGAFLAGYKIAERNLDNTASFIAGLGALCLAWFPTKPQCLTVHNTVIAPKAKCMALPYPVLTPLEKHWTPTRLWYLHIGGTALFVGGLAVVSYLFGVREGKWPSKVRKKRSPKFWRRFHKTAALVMVWGILFILTTSVPHHRFGPSWDVLIGEVTCAWAFGWSWLLKGWEWDTLRGRTARERVRDSTWQGNAQFP
jgi:hypothetical protein